MTVTAISYTCTALVMMHVRMQFTADHEAVVLQSAKPNGFQTIGLVREQPWYVYTGTSCYILASLVGPTCTVLLPG